MNLKLKENKIAIIGIFLIILSILLLVSNNLTNYIRPITSIFLMGSSKGKDIIFFGVFGSLLLLSPIFSNKLLENIEFFNSKNWTSKDFLKASLYLSVLTYLLAILLEIMLRLNFNVPIDTIFVSMDGTNINTTSILHSHLFKSIIGQIIVLIMNVPSDIHTGISLLEYTPVLSYLIQGGKCRSCKAKIPISYLLMEICTGVLFAVCYHVFDLSLGLISGLIFVSSLITIIISDIEYMIILDEVLIFAILGIIIVDIFNIGLYNTSIQILYGIGSFITMLLIKKLGDILFKQESLGGGDIKLMFLIGLVIGYEMAVCNIFFATFIAFPIALFLLITKKDNIIPFGPFLSMSAIILFIWGLTFSDIINFILS